MSEPVLLASFVTSERRHQIAALAPSRYVVVTSVPLSPANKATIVGAVPSAPFVASDVFGQEDLNNLLGQYPGIEQRARETLADEPRSA